MANTIKIKNSGTTSNVPASLEHGELAINYTDGKIFYKNNANTIVEFLNSRDLNSIYDVVITDPVEFQTLEYNGTNWVNSYASNVTFARNDETTTITTGTVVYVSGSTGDHAKVKRADNDADTTSATILGVMASDTAASQNGPIITLGYVDGIDLSVGYTAGDILWLGENGGFTTTKPVAPEHLVFVGIVVRATNNGIIFVAPQNGYELDELHNVLISNTLASGDFLKYNGTVWVNDPINLGTDTVGNYMTDVSAGTGISISHTPSEGSTATITNSGVTGITGTANQISASNSTGSVTLSLPTNITVSGNVTANTNLVSNFSSGDEGGEIALATPQSNTTLSGPVKVDIYQNKIRFFESGGSARGAYIDLTAAGSGASTNLLGTAGAMNYAQTVGTKQSGISSAGTTIVSVSITTSGYPVQVVVTGDVENNSAGGWTVLQLYRGSTAIGNPVHTEGSAGSENVPYALTVIDTPDAGTYTYALKLNNSAGGTFNFGESNGPVITAIELAGRIGATGPAGNISSSVINDLSDVTAPSPSAGQYLAFNGSAWVNSGIVMADITDGQAIASNSSPTFAGLTINGNVSATGSVVDHVSTNQQTASYTLVLTDDGKMVEMNVGSANNLTVPADNTVNFPVGTSIDILQVGSGQTTIVAASGVTINRATGLKLRAQWSAATLIKRAANTWVAIGDLSA